MGPLNKFHLTPVLCTAAGAAAGYYILFYSANAVTIFAFLILTAAFCFFRVVASLYTQSHRFQHFSACCTALAIGLALGICAANAGRSEVNFGIPENRVIAVEGILLEDPRIISGGSAMVSLSLRRSAGAGGLRVSSSGMINVFFPDANADKIKQFGRGTTVFAEGNLRHTAYGWSLSAQSLHVLKPASSFERMRTNIRLGLTSRFENETWGGLSLALLLGIRDNLDSGFSSLYSNAGLSYILALSGMHLAILTALIAFLLKRFLGLKVSAAAGAVIIIFYCILVGPMPSLNRAVLMYIIGVIAVLGAFPKNTISILSLSFLIQIIITPASGNTLSFKLSYLALIGIIITGQALASLFAGKVPDFLLQPLSISAGAFLATAGICSFTFGTLAPAGIIAGLAIVPLTTIFMIGSIIWLALSLFPFSAILDFPLSILYRLMETTASAAGRMPVISANPYLVLVISVSLSFLIIALEHRRKLVMLQIQPFT